MDSILLRELPAVDDADAVRTFLLVSDAFAECVCGWEGYRNCCMLIYF